MPKLKTNSGARKRFKLTAKGKIKYKKGFKNHILTKKSSKRKRNLGRKSLIDSSDIPRIKKLIGA